MFEARITVPTFFEARLPVAYLCEFSLIIRLLEKVSYLDRFLYSSREKIVE
jgi:hypothetical protein